MTNDFVQMYGLPEGTATEKWTSIFGTRVRLYRWFPLNPVILELLIKPG